MTPLKNNSGTATMFSKQDFNLINYACCMVSIVRHGHKNTIDASRKNTIQHGTKSEW